MERNPDETGFVVVWTREQSTYRLPPEVYEDIKTAWMAGRSFFECTTYWGAPITIKLSVIESLQLSTPEALKAWKAEVAAEKYTE